MKLGLFGSAVSAAALAYASSAHAGETPVYDVSPEWVEIVSIEDADAEEANDLIVSDRQVRIEEGLRWDYYDKVFRVSGSTDLSKAGTLKFQWFPDKGDLIVHEVSIIRDGEILDVLAEGAEIEVLRRERRLEQGILDGILTATLAVPGLEVNDQLRMRYSVTASDQALGEDVQSQLPLWRETPSSQRGMVALRMLGGMSEEADFSRVRVSWPEDLNVGFKAGPDLEIGEAAPRDGYQWLEFTMPLPEADPVPRDAPYRFRMPAMLQLGTFADWAAVSSRMAPFYEVEGSLDDLPDLVEKIDAIAAQPLSDLEKAVDALELVQEDIRYLMNGLDGGNYIPQDVATTWRMKYGDCKAKTVMLLALLDRLGIEAEAVLASTNRGNAVPASLPIPGAFNHVLVRATIEGQEYFLDGTSLGANIKTVGNVPPFQYYLPIAESGASLAEIRQTLPRMAETEMHFEADGSAGLDLPTIGTMQINIIGPRAAQLNAEKEKTEEAMMGGAAFGVGRGFQIVDVAIEQGEDDSEATVKLNGVMPAFFKFDGNRGEFTPGQIAKRAKFSPNRSQRQWLDIPAAIGNPSASVNSIRAKLPFAASELEVDGTFDLEAEAAGKTFTRKVELDGDEIYVFERLTNRGGEIAPGDILEERRKSARIAGEALKFIAPEDAPRRWQFAGRADRSALNALEEVYAQAIEHDPDEARPYLSRAQFRSQTFDFKGAMEDFTAAIEIEATADLLSQRADMHAQLRDLESARADLEEAYMLDPTPTRAMALANMMANQGEVSAAKDMLELEEGDAQARQLLNFAIAEFEALLGETGAGLERISEELADDPNNATLLNEKCWFIATWQVQLDEGEEACRLAVERGNNAAQALDSRAMYQLRIGELDEARADIEEALSIAPWQAESLLLQGLIKREQGDETADQDIEQALARRPGLVDQYQRWGFPLGKQ